MTDAAPALDLDGLLRRLHLPTVRRLYPELAHRAEGESLAYREFLAVLMAEEVAHRAQTRIQRCVHRAHFPFLKTVDEFDFTFQSGVRLSLLGSALSADFITQGQSLTSAGPAARGRRTWRSPSPTARSRTASTLSSPPRRRSSKISRRRRARASSARSCPPTRTRPCS